MHALRRSVAAVLRRRRGGRRRPGWVRPEHHPEYWVCLNPVTGFEDGSVFDADHYSNGVFDPCHCYDPEGPSKACPIPVDAGSD